jgi:peroxiredoxin
VYITPGQTDRQPQLNGNPFRKISYLLVLIVIAGLAAAASGCSASPQTGIEVSADYEVVVPAAAMQAGEVQPMAAPEQLAAPEAEVMQADEAQKLEMNQVIPPAVQEENSLAAPLIEIVTEAPQPTQVEQPTESPAVEEAAPAEALPPAEPKVGFLAPDLTLTALDGSLVRLADLRGKNVLINYWVTWCIPCMDELPILSQLSQDYQDQNVIILTVNGIEQDQLGEVQQLVAELGLTQPVLLDEHESFWSTYLVQFLPTSFFIDTQGVIRHIMLGSATEDAIRSKIDQLIVNQL